MTRRLVWLGIALVMFVGWTKVFTRLLKARPRVVILGSETVQFSPDGSLLEMRGRFWDSTTGELHWVCPPDASDPRSPRLFSPSGRYYWNGAIWDLQQKRRLTKPVGWNYCDACCFSANERYLAAGFSINTSPPRVPIPREVLCFDVATGKELARVPGLAPHAFTTDCQNLVFREPDQEWLDTKLRVLNTTTGESRILGVFPKLHLTKIIEVDSAMTSMIAIDEKATLPPLAPGMKVLSPGGGPPVFLRIWDLLTQRSKAELRCDEVLRRQTPEPKAKLSPATENGQRLLVFEDLSGLGPHRLIRLDANRPNVFHHSQASRIAISDDFRQVLMIGTNSAQVYRLPEMDEVAVLELPALDVTNDPYTLKKTPPDSWYYSKSAFAANQPFVLLETIHYTPPEARNQAYDQIFWALNPAYAKKPKPAPSTPTFTEFLDRELRLFDATTGAELFRFPACEQWVVSPTGKQIAIHRNNEVQLWDLPPAMPWPLILSMAFVHTLLILGPCWYFARRNQAVPEEPSDGRRLG